MNTQLDRIEARLQDVDNRTRAIEVSVAGMKGEKTGEEKSHRWIGGLMKHALTAVVAVVAGALGGQVPGAR